MGILVVPTSFDFQSVVQYFTPICGLILILVEEEIFFCRIIRPYILNDRIQSPLLFRINMKDLHGEFSPCFIDNIPDDSIMILEGIKSSRATRERWKSMMNDSRTGVTFDLYYCGILFFDKRIKQNYIVNF